MIRKKLTAIAAMTALVAMMQTAQAAFTDTLFNLKANNGSLSIGDKTFNGFDYLASGLTGFDANLIQVTASVDGAGVYYLTWAGSIALVSGGPAVADLLLNYTVTANAGSIFMIDQKYTGSAQPAGGAFLAVDETVYDGITIVANSHLEVGDLSDPFVEIGDDLIINPALTTLRVTKDIGLGIASPSGGFVTISEVSQSFHQVPEPTTMIAGALLLLPFGASTIRFLRKNRTA